MLKFDLEKAKEAEIKWPTSVGSEKKQENSRKTSTSALLTLQKAFECVDHNKLESSSRDGNTRPPHLPPEKSVSRSRSNSYNWIYNRLVLNQERSMLRLYIVTMFNL